MVSVLLCLALAVTSQSATLEWDANPPTDAVTNYVLHWGTNVASAGTNLSYSLTNFPPGVYRFTLTAQANGVESLPSEELAWTNRPAAPSLRIKVSLRSKTSLDGPWEQELQFTEMVLPDDRQRFFQTQLFMERQ
jgi:hypothetical protein